MTRVSTVSIGGAHIAFPFSVLEQNPVVNYEVGDQRIVVFYNPASLSVLDHEEIAESRRVGATMVFQTTVRAWALTFRMEESKIIDDETGSEWTILGEAVGGPLKGTKLVPVIHTDSFWFSWASFHPDTLVYRGE